MTQVAATQPVFRGCSVALPVFEPGVRTLFEQAAPTFKARHMWMAGLRVRGVACPTTSTPRH